MKRTVYIPFFLILIFGACSTSKNIPEGKYLLDKFEVKHDTKNATSDLEDYVRQQPNSRIPLLGKVRLGIYNMAGQDTSKWINRFIQKMGQAPVIFNSSQTNTSAAQLQKQLINQGYLDAVADTVLKIKGNKISVIYNLKGGTPYRIRNYKYDITTDTTMARIMGRIPLKPLLNKGDMFDMDLLEEERQLVNTIMRNVGYHNFSKEYVYFKADTTLNTHEVDLVLDIYPTKDSLLYPRYKLNKVTVVSGVNFFSNPNGTGNRPRNPNRQWNRNIDTTQYRDITILRGRSKFLRSTSIYRNNYMRPGAYYSDINQTRTYEAYDKMGAVKGVSITTVPSSQDSLRLLDAMVILTPANAHWFKAGLDGTNSAGDLGVSPSIAYQHQNLFNGGEQLSIKLKGAYEFVPGEKGTNLADQNYYEYGFDAGVSFPLFLVPWLKKKWRELPSATTRVSIGLNNQRRVQYNRQFFNLTVNYGWSSKRNRLKHTLDFMDVNYIRMPWMSDKFKEDYIENPNNPLLRESYRDQLVARTGYTVSLVNERRSIATYTLRGSIELAGVVPHLISSVRGTKPDEYGQKNILGVAYAEYVKGTVDYARTFNFSKRHSLAYHATLGLAHPFANSDILPFERRFFSGGANSIRGWSTRALGPGSYQRNGEGSDFVNQTGDMKLEMNIENRYKVNSFFEFAQFIDAGNIWTLKNYASQPEGQFKFNRFYKEIAVSYGVGIRLNAGFIIRLDAGMRAYDPELKQADRLVLFRPRLSRAAWHFGIGYPF